MALKYTTMYPQRVSRVVFLSPMSPTIALWDERVKHLDSLKTEVGPMPRYVFAINTSPFSH